MKNSISLLAIYVVIALFVSCSNDNDCNCSEDIYGKWEVEEFMSVESVLYAKKDGFNPIVEFKEDGILKLNLDKNSCGSDFELNGKTGINIIGAICTRMCCDSDFSNKFALLLPQIETYEIEGDKMKLNIPGWGWIVLERISD
ncbi:META domain-containing protein [uncultured Draconibacterium sp.]|uniref:META domain-containing protein n=1 Tax=uncultured Draconibacterium sp. TaxID=1573823 RepID=UPI0032177857